MTVITYEVVIPACDYEYFESLMKENGYDFWPDQDEMDAYKKQQEAE